MGQETEGLISEIINGQGFYAFVPYTDTDYLSRHDVQSIRVRISDGREISTDQRKKIYATMGEMSAWSGQEPEQVKALMKYDYIAHTGEDYFSLSDCSVTTANGFLEHLIEFCVEWGIPCEDSLSERTPDMARYIYFCVVNRKCAVCGKKADIHEYDAVGMGRDRRKIHHVGVRVIPLCRKHHSEAEHIGRDTFCDKHHLTWVKLDANACETLRWKK